MQAGYALDQRLSINPLLPARPTAHPKQDNLIQELARAHGLQKYVYKNTELAKWAREGQRGAQQRPAAARAPPPAQPRARRGA